MLSRVKSLLQYSSDLHLEKGLHRDIKIKKPYLLLAGDIGCPFHINYKNFLITLSDYYDKIFLLSGNHEYDYRKDIIETELKIKDICSIKNNIFFLQKDTHVICDKENIVIAGCTLWSTLPSIKTVYHLDHKMWLNNIINNNLNNNYVIATHHCPLYQCLNTKYNSEKKNYFASDQSKLLLNKNIICWIHGHNHLNKNINFNGKWLLTNQYGSYKDPLYGYII